MAERMACLVNCLPQPRPLHTLADDAIDVPWTRLQSPLQLAAVETSVP